MIYRRANSRFVINSKAFLVLKDGKKKNVLLQDLSSEGAAVIVDSPLEKKEKVRINITAPSLLTEPADLEAEVVWIQPIDNNLWRIGLCFGINKIDLPILQFPKEHLVRRTPKEKLKLRFVFATLFIVLILVGITLLFLSTREITLRGVSFDSKGNSRALINDHFVSEGEIIEGNIKVNKIEEEAVEVIIGGESKVLKLNKKLIYFQK